MHRSKILSGMVLYFDFHRDENTTDDGDSREVFAASTIFVPRSDDPNNFSLVASVVADISIGSINCLKISLMWLV